MTVLWATWLLLDPNVSLLTGDGSALMFRPAEGAGGSSPKSRRLALPAAGELYLSWTESGEGGTSERRREE